MPFVYTTPVAPAAASIGELLARRGDIAAAGTIGAGNAQAAGTLGAGQAWGQGIANAGNVAGNAIVRTTSPQAKMAAIQLDEAQKQQRSRNVMEAALRDPGNFKPDGSVDSAKVGDFLKKNDVGAWQSWLSISNAMDEHALKLREGIQTIAKNDLDIAGKQQEMQAKQRDYLGALAFTTEQHLKAKPDDPLHARDTFMAAVARGVSDGAINPDEGKALLMHTAQATPAQLQDLVASAVPPQQRSELESKAAATRKANAEAAVAEAEARAGGKVTEAQLNNELVNLYAKQKAGQPLTPEETARLQGFEAKAGQEPITIKTMVNGQPVERVMTKAAAMQAGVFPSQPPAQVQITNMTAAATAGLPAWMNDASKPTGPDVNKPEATTGLTPNGLYQAVKEYLATGRFPPTGIGNQPRPAAIRAAITNKAGAIAAEAGMDVPTLQALYKANAGSLGQQQKFSDAAQAFLETADKNSALLESTLAKIPDTGSPLLNKPIRAISQQALGSVLLAQFKTYLQSVQNEYAKILTQPNLAGQLTDSARREAEQLVSPDATVAQILGSLQALRTEGGNRLTSIGDQIARIQQRMNGGAPAPAASTPVSGPMKVGGFTVVVK